MKGVKIFVVAVLALIGLLSSLSLAMAALTGPVDLPSQPLELTARKGQVLVEKADTNNFEDVVGTVQVLPGDTVQTGPDGEASVNLFDEGVLHIAPNSVIVLEEILWDEAEPDVLQGNVFLEAGGLWSRIFDFVSANSSFEVRTSSTVATVRGTTFWVTAEEQDLTRVYVDDHRVNMKSLSNNETLDVTNGKMARLHYVNNEAKIGFVNPTTGDQTLIEIYKKWDTEYEAEVMARKLALAKDARPYEPGSFMSDLERLAENLRLWLANETKENELRSHMVIKRLLDAYIALNEHDNSGQARDLVKEARQLAGPEIGQNPDVRRVILYFGRLNLGPDKDWGEEILRDVPNETIEAAAQNGVIEVETEATLEVAPKPSTTAPVLQPDPKPTPEPVQEEPEVAEPTQPVIEEPVVEPVVEPQPVPDQPTAVVVPTPTSLSLIIDDNALYVGETTTLRVYQHWSNGMQTDVTESVDWSVSTDQQIGKPYGYIKDNVFTAEYAGDATITAYYTDPDNTRWTALGNVTISQWSTTTFPLYLDY